MRHGSSASVERKPRQKMKLKRPIIALIALLFVSPAIAQSTKPDRDLLVSKADAAMVFSMDRKAWNTNVVTAVRAGAAKALGKADRGFGMATLHATGYLIVKPDYSSAEKPDFVQVTVGYREPFSRAFTDEALNETIKQAEAEMMPEYQIIGNIHRTKGGVGVFFIISRSSKPK